MRISDYEEYLEWLKVAPKCYQNEIPLTEEEFAEADEWTFFEEPTEKEKEELCEFAECREKDIEKECKKFMKECPIRHRYDAIYKLFEMKNYLEIICRNFESDKDRLIDHSSELDFLKATYNSYFEQAVYLMGYYEQLSEYIAEHKDVELARKLTEFFPLMCHTATLGCDVIGYCNLGILYQILDNIQRMTEYFHELYCPELPMISRKDYDLENDVDDVDEQKGNVFGKFSVVSSIPLPSLYKFLCRYTVSSGKCKGKAVIDGEAISCDDFIRSVQTADYKSIFECCIKSKMRSVIYFLASNYFKDKKAYLERTAKSIDEKSETFSKYVTDKNFNKELEEILPLIKK